MSRMLNSQASEPVLRRLATDRSGVTAIVTGIGMTMLLGFAGVAVDVAYWLNSMRGLQSAADQAAFSAAVAAGSTGCSGLRLPRHQGWPRQARRDPRRYAIRRAGLVHQHPAGEIRQSEAARGAGLRLRLRMDQQEHHVRLLRAHPFGVPEFRHDGQGQTRCRGTGSVGAISRQGVRRGVRRAVRAAGVRRFGPGSRAVAARLAAFAGGGLRHQGPQARQRQGRTP